MELAESIIPKAGIHMTKYPLPTIRQQNHLIHYSRHAVEIACFCYDGESSNKRINIHHHPPTQSSWRFYKLVCKRYQKNIWYELVCRFQVNKIITLNNSHIQNYRALFPSWWRAWITNFFFSSLGRKWLFGCTWWSI